MYHFIINPGSRTGNGRRLWNVLKAELERRNVEYKSYFTEAAGHAAEYARAICAENPGTKKIVIVGGDGTANEAINGLSGYSDIMLGYIPTGSSNDLARGLGISTDPMKALETVLFPREFRAVDHGVMEHDDGTGGIREGERRFAVSSGIGYDADICYEALTAKLKNVLNRLNLGKLIYFIIGIKQVFANNPAEAELTIDGVQKRKYNKLIFIANMNLPKEGGGLPMAPNADPSDGCLDCLIVHDIPKIKHLVLMPSIFKGRHIKYKGVELIRCKSLEVKLNRPLVVHTDGEFAGSHSHAVFRCMDEKILMML